MSRLRRPLGPRWRSWGRDVGLGYSWRAGDLRADLEPGKDEATGLVEWRATVWRGRDRTDVVAELTGRTHWQVAAEVDERFAGVAP